MIRKQFLSGYYGKYNLYLADGHFQYTSSSKNTSKNISGLDSTFHQHFSNCKSTGFLLPCRNYRAN